jgi:aminoglycoside 6'-N-acetyltransferase I
MEFAIRSMQAGEEPAWGAMRSRLWPDCGPEDNAADMAELGNPEGALRIVFFGLVGSKIVGFAEISERSLVDGAGYRPAAYLEGWYVEPGYRRSGIGSALVRAAADWARTEGYAYLGSDAELDNLVSHAAHARSGFREIGRGVNFVMALTP